ncbi:MAG: hypothetical protein OSA84_12265 [Akkermansiaceae bacterium]|nr:hypothetical protein [Akkermansiaceae bacterium]
MEGGPWSSRWAGSEGGEKGLIEEEWRKGGKLPLAAALRCKVRYFTDGAVLGTKNFVDRFFEQKREHFGPRRESGARRILDADWGGLRVLRYKNQSAINLPGHQKTSPTSDKQSAGSAAGFSPIPMAKSENSTTRPN